MIDIPTGWKLCDPDHLCRTGRLLDEIIKAGEDWESSINQDLDTITLAKKASKLILLVAEKEAEKEFRSQFNSRLRVEMCNPYIDPEEDFLE